MSKLDPARDGHSQVQMADVRNLLASIADLDRDYLVRCVEGLSLDGPVPGSDRNSDTAAEAAEQGRRLVLRRSGEKRLTMGSSMHATALALVRASVLAQDPKASPAVPRRAVFLRLYGDEFFPEAREKILARLALAGAE
jgi:hypothetical protein